MKIIDNKKDYYDYLSGVYGTDELAVYDRRGSVTWAQYKERFQLFIDTKRVKDDVFIPLKKSRWWRPHRRFLCVEAGKRQFLIMAERIVPKESADIDIILQRNIVLLLLQVFPFPSHVECINQILTLPPVFFRISCGDVVLRNYIDVFHDRHNGHLIQFRLLHISDQHLKRNVQHHAIMDTACGMVVPPTGPGRF